MKKALLFILSLFFATSCFATDGLDVFRAGLQAFQTNGADALLSTWYTQDEQEKLTGLRKRLTSMTEHLGTVIDTEVFAPKDLGRHVQRLYGVIYFQKRPIWLRAEYYTIDGRGGFISLEFSREASEILPVEVKVAN
ncbi:MAG: hypothetical protein QM715_06250 [Nibricoccus sp.]